MKLKERKVLDQIRRLNAGLHWSKVEGLLRSLGAEVTESKGSRIRIWLADEDMVVDRPHPAPECGMGLVKRVRRLLTRAGVL